MYEPCECESGDQTVIRQWSRVLLCVSGSVSRWDFIQGEAAMQAGGGRLSAKASSAKLYRRKLQKRLMHHEQQLLMLQQAKKNFMEGSGGGVGAGGGGGAGVGAGAGGVEEGGAAGGSKDEVQDQVLKTEQLFEKHLKQYSYKVRGDRCTGPGRNAQHGSR